MDYPIATAEMSELAAALLQGVITAGLATLCWFLYRRYRKPYLAWWTAAWTLYVLRLLAIASFLLTHDWSWLYWHQVVTGWTALALLGAALVFSRGFRLRWRHLPLALFPPLWSYVAIYRIDDFGWAAGPAVGFLSLATLWTGWVFLSYHRRVGSSGAALLAASFALWGLHHLDYPFLRARGAWSPWGYYLDLLFALFVGAGILLLVLDDLRRGLGALAALSADLQRRGRERPILDALLERPLALPAVTGSALYLIENGAGRFVGGAGACATWPTSEPAGPPAVVAEAMATGKPRLAANWPGPAPTNGVPHPYAAVLPVSSGNTVTGALVIVGEARDPFAALDEDFLVALGRQVGAALEHDALYERLEARTSELERLSMRMLAQHEDERRRLSRELHDETAQLFSAVKMELALLRDGAWPDAAARLERSLALVDAGIQSIRRVTHDLRPTLLDDLGLVPALRSLVSEFGERSGASVELSAPPVLPRLDPQTELAVFRALQEALANVARHAGARSVRVAIAVDREGVVMLEVRDDGRGLPPGSETSAFEQAGHMGLAGMRERIAALGGRVELRSRPGNGLTVSVYVPTAAGACS
ncbi:MAG TPA: GAF domain-containing sensor histidine kinase [Gemmatimonadales bacterium]|nr:GAF domain-containing sensor histidine kinase [Gemmatimonadales bacterium]